MLRISDPFAIKEWGGDIADRDVSGWSRRAFEGTSLGESEVGSLKRIISQRVPALLFIILLGLISILAGRTIWLQVIQGNYWRGVAEGNRIRLEIVNPSRGLISDSQGKILAYNVASFRLVAVPAELPRDEVKREELLTSILADIPTELLHQENITKLAKPSYLPLVIASPIPHDLALNLMILTNQATGLRVEPTAERYYHKGEALAHLLGYVGPISALEYETNKGLYQLNDSKGKVGLEFVYEDLLRGKPGARQVEVDASGLERKVYATRPAVAGAKINLTIDSELQQLAYSALARAVSNSPGSKGGSLIAINPSDGSVRALLSYPSYDPNVFTSARNSETIAKLLNDDRYPLFNRALAGEYPPGSTIKPLLAVAALQEKIINPSTTFMSTGGVYAGNKFFADWKAGGHGPTNVYKAIAESVNTFFYLIGGGTADRIGLGISRISDYLNRFGLGRNTAIDLPGERSGFIPTPLWKQEVMKDRWYRGDTYNVSIGQGNLLVTPIQIAVAYAALVNGGDLIKPHLIDSVTYPNGKIVKYQPVKQANIGLSMENLKIVQQGMRQTVISGSARSLSSLPIDVAGKTGTAQTGSTSNTHAWFAGYIPAINPELVVVIMIENGGEGSQTAVPVARELFNWYANQLGAKK